MEFSSVYLLNNCQNLWHNQPSFLLYQILFILGGICTLKHAITNGRIWIALWLITLLNGTITELVAIFTPEISNFWHGQGPIMLFNKRLPLGIALAYPCFYYISIYLVSTLCMPKKYRPFTVGLVTLLLDLPCEMIGVKYLHWTWHTSDPNLFEKSYGVPWCNYIFHFIFSAVISAVSERMFFLESRNKWHISHLLKYLLFGILVPLPATFLSMAFFFHLLHDIMHISSQIIIIGMISVSGSLLIAGILSSEHKRVRGFHNIHYLSVYLFIHYSLPIIVSIIFDPQKHVSTGFHQPLGDCSISEEIPTLLGLIWPQFVSKLM